MLAEIRSVTAYDARTVARTMLDGPIALASIGGKLALAA